VTDRLSDQLPAGRTPRPVPPAGDPDTPSGSAPSVTTAIPPKCPTRTRQYRDGEVVAEGFPVEDSSELLRKEDGSVVWLDLRNPDLDDLRFVSEEFGLHPLAVEDAVQDHQRPKLDRYPAHLFVNVYAVDVPGGASTVRVSEISVFVTPRALITVRKSDFDVDTLLARWDMDKHLARRHGVSYLLYGLLDAIADGHYDAVQALEDLAEDLEDALFDPKSGIDVRRGGFELRRALGRLRRVVGPMPELLARLMRPDLRLAVDGLEAYFRDIADHTQHTAEAVDATRDIVSSVLDADLNEKSNQLNEITKKLASWAAIIAVPTAVTGFYGQNVPYPGFGRHYGFLESVIVMVVLAGGVFFLLRRRGWL
jgi:magnesium transporter